MRVLHISDLHIPAPLVGVPLAEWLGKRLVGLANHRLRRLARFKHARAIVAQLAQVAQELQVDVVLCSGDFTTMGTEVEMKVARSAIMPLIRLQKPMVAVPGNHDLYLRDSVHAQRFNRYFGDMATTDHASSCCDGLWPFVRYFGPLAVVGINSARPNPEPWKSSGYISPAQLDALPALLKAVRARAEHTFVLTHYGIVREDGSADHPRHALDNAQELAEACGGAERVALLHGHIHRLYAARTENGLRTFCAGSSTQGGQGSFWMFELEPQQVTATPGVVSENSFELRQERSVRF